MSLDQMHPHPTIACRIGRHKWDGTNEHRRCVRCMKIRLRGDGTKGRMRGKWFTRQQYSFVWCECGNELSGCPFTECDPIEGGASRVMYDCGRCGRRPIFDFGLAPAPIKVDPKEARNDD